MPHTPLHGWKERDRKAEEKRKKAKGQPSQKPLPKKLGDFANKLRDKAGNLKAKSQANRKEKEKKLRDFGEQFPALPGAKALAKEKAKKRDAMRWKTGEKRDTIELKKGGKVRGAGLARRRRSVK